MTTDPRLSIGTQATAAGAGAVREALDGLRPVVRVEPTLPPLAANAAGALLSILLRVHPHTELEGDAECGPNPWGAIRLAEIVDMLGPVRPEASMRHFRDVVITVGQTRPGDLAVGGDDWNVALGAEPLPVRSAGIGLGIHAGAAFAAAEVLKLALIPLGLVAVRLPDHFRWNLIDHRMAPVALDHALGVPPPLLMAAAGSVNSSAAAQIMGFGAGTSVTVVDPDDFDPVRNPYRYPAAVPGVHGPKADWVAEMLRSGGWRATARPGDVAGWVTSMPRPGFDGILISSVDSVDGRADVADVLARTTLSAGVDGLALHLQHESALGEAACPYCDFVSAGHPITQIEQWAGLTGLGAARVAVLIAGTPLTEADVALVVAAGCVSQDAAPDLVGRRLNDLIGRVYAEAAVPIAGADPIRVSAPFVSWIAGTLIAAEVAKAAAGLPLIDRRADLDMSGVPPGAVRRLPRDPTGRCLCASPWRRRAARALYRPGRTPP
jgi:hypothetical protein